MSDAQSREPIESMWGAIPNYECPIVLPSGDRCGFASLDYALAVQHLDPRFGAHRVTAAENVPPVAPTVTDEERAELVALREENDTLKRELTTTKGQLTKAKNQLDKTAPDAEGDE